jgi:hypothetical protein
VAESLGAIIQSWQSAPANGAATSRDELGRVGEWVVGGDEGQVGGGGGDLTPLPEREPRQTLRPSSRDL